MNEELEKGKKGINNYLRYSGLGFQIAGTVAIGVFIGYELDKCWKLPSHILLRLFLCCLCFWGFISGLESLLNQNNSHELHELVLAISYSFV